MKDYLMSFMIHALGTATVWALASSAGPAHLPATTGGERLAVKPSPTTQRLAVTAKDLARLNALAAELQRESEAKQAELERLRREAAAGVAAEKQQGQPQKQTDPTGGAGNVQQQQQQQQQQVGTAPAATAKGVAKRAGARAQKNNGPSAKPAASKSGNGQGHGGSPPRRSLPTRPPAAAAKIDYAGAAGPRPTEAQPNDPAAAGAPQPRPQESRHPHLAAGAIVLPDHARRRNPRGPAANRAGPPRRATARAAPVGRPALAQADRDRDGLVAPAFVIDGHVRELGQLLAGRWAVCCLLPNDSPAVYVFDGKLAWEETRPDSMTPYSPRCIDAPPALERSARRALALAGHGQLDPERSRVVIAFANGVDQAILAAQQDAATRMGRPLEELVTTSITIRRVRDDLEFSVAWAELSDGSTVELTPEAPSPPPAPQLPAPIPAGADDAGGAVG